MVTSAMCQSLAYEVLPEFVGERNIIPYNIKDIVKDAVREIMSEQTTLISSQQQSASAAQTDTLKHMLRTDQKELMDSIYQCARKEQLEAIRHLIASERDCTFSGVDSRRPKTLTLVGASIPPQHMLEDAALGKPTYSSSIHSGAFPTYNANDGNDGSMFHSLRNIQPWWMVDLGAERTIYNIIILTRHDCCYERFHDVEIRIGNTLRTDGDFSTHTLISFYKGPYTLDQGSLVYTFCNGIKGRYLSVKIESIKREFLQINTFKAIALKK